MGDGVSVRPVERLEDARAAARLFDTIWGEQRVVGTPLLWAMASHGGQVLAAFQGGEMVGAQVGVIGIRDGKPRLHSHITGVLPGVQHSGVGFQLKLAQREWCLQRGIERVTWTFDPMVARNAYFNLVKLGAVAERFHRNYYGEMEDAFNRGDRSDRLEVVWELRAERVRAALGEAPAQRTSSNLMAPPRVMEVDGRPEIATEPLRSGAGTIAIAVPEDYHGLRERDPELAGSWRDAVADALDEAIRAGYRPTTLARGEGTTYLLEEQ